MLFEIFEKSLFKSKFAKRKISILVDILENVDIVFANFD